MHARRGFTLLDQLLTLLVLGALLALGLQGVGALRDRLSVHAARRALTDALALAREHASAAGTRTAVRFESGGARVSVHVGTDTVHQVPLAARHGVQLVASRDSMAYMPSGLGFGAANVRLILTRGHAADTITVSRLGRVR